MVIHECSEIPFEVPNPMDSKKYIVVKNHVRELSTDRQKTCSTNTIEENPKKSAKKRKKTLDHSSDNVSDTLAEDIQELRTVYRKCKTIVAKIESKYGHLLDLDTENNCSNKKRKLNQEDSDCNCVLNKKIVFDDDGKQIQDIQDATHEHLSSTHICPKRLLIKDPYKIYQQTANVTVEEDNLCEMLPNNLIELSEILKKSDISNTLRNSVIDKVKHIRNQNTYDIKFDKSGLIKQVKSDPNSVISFKGSNLSTLQGYPEPT